LIRFFERWVHTALSGLAALIAGFCFAAERDAPLLAPDLVKIGSALPGGLGQEDKARLTNGLKNLSEKLARLRSAFDDKASNAQKLDLLADADLFHKGIVWALRYETNLTAKDIALIDRSLKRGEERADALLAGQHPWTRKLGKIVRGYISAVDGSTQPYGIVLPAGYDGRKPFRLDVVLHGSTRPTGLSELRFGAPFDEGDDEAKLSPIQDFIELHPLGRVENCYRWAGETDVFEAMEAVCRQYNIDRDRIVLRGMSMGASGTWHLGLKHPDLFVALGPYCGYVDTHRFSETPIPNFIKVGPLPAWQEGGLHMLDSVDYAANAGVVPAIAAIGDQDVFFQAHVIMGEAMAREGLQMVNLISHGTGHVIDPATHGEQMRRIGEFVAKGLDHTPRHLRFVTWTLKYNRCHWLEVLALKEHYERAEIEAALGEDGSVEMKEPRNITQFAIHPPILQSPRAKLRIAGKEVAFRIENRAAGGERLVFELKNGSWQFADKLEPAVLSGKRPGLQGPIDDAFTAPFLCVRGTGQPWNSKVGAWAEASLRRFAYEWARYMRGDLPIKNDTDVTDADVRTKNLILFGDPGSNIWIRKAIPNLRLSWSSTELRLGSEKQSAKECAPVLICASPLPGAEDHYIVLNSGHTFHEKEFAAFNYLLFPRLGDWAVMRITGDAEKWEPSLEFPEEVIRAGFFNESWEEH
jgi:hypothetical protein